VLLTALLLVLAGCGGSEPSAPGSPVAPGLDPVAEPVDGLVVGHRLMAAGEYDLALSAYTRAAGERGLTVDTLSAIGSAQLRLGRLGQAERSLRQALERDERFVPAWNNLGVVLMETGRAAEARNVFQTAYALDSGNSDEIRDNLRRALARLDENAYPEPENEEAFQLVRRGNGRYLLLSTPR
jgi:Flp pilus assembly protein TadD